MRLIDEQNAGIVLQRLRPMRAVTLAGLLGAVVSVVPLVIAPEAGAMRFATSGVLAVSSLLLLVLGWTRPERVELVLRDGGVSWGGEPLAPPERVELAGYDIEEPPLYRAEVVWADGRRRVALESAEPARVLRDALSLAERLGLPLRPGWGLEKHFSETGFASAWRLASSRAGSAATSKDPIDAPLWPAQRRAGVITLVSGFFVLIVTFTLIESPARSVEPSAFSLSLPALSGALVLALGTILVGLRRRIVLSADGVFRTTVLFGRRVDGASKLADPSALVFGVAPDGGGVRHLLFAANTVSFSVPADEELARSLSERPARSPGVSTRLPSREPSLQAVTGPKGRARLT